MPGIRLVARETTYSRGLDQICYPEAHVLPPEEQAAAEASLSAYCKPIELYNIIQHRSNKQRLSLQRCLHYKIEAKHKRRIQISVSISGAIKDGLHTQSLFPLYIFLTRAVSNANAEGRISAVYRYRRVCRLTASDGAETVSSAQAKFILPEISRLSAEVKSGSLDILLVTCAADIANPQGIDLIKDHISASSNFEGYCLFGKIPMNVLLPSLAGSRDLNVGGRVEMTSIVSMQSCFMKLSCSDEGKHVSFQYQKYSEAMSTILKQVPVVISAEELGAKDISAYNMYLCNGASSTSVSNIRRLRIGNVIFNYRYYNNSMQKTEVIEDFRCPFCLVKGSSFKGLKCHLTSSHDLFRYEFWVNEDYQVVNVFLKTSASGSEIVADKDDPRQHTFFMCFNRLRRRKPKSSTQIANNVHPLLLDSEVPERAEHGTCSASAGVLSAAGCSFAESGSAQPGPGNNPGPPSLLRFEKTRKLSVGRSEPRSRALLKKRQFFHSHRAQPMDPEHVLADQDSEDEVDDDVADLEDRRMLDDFLDVTKDEKQVMHLWNSFIRKQRVLADGHIPWACEAFSKLHGKDLVRNPPLLWCWKLLMIKLWNHGLLDPRAINDCSVILERFQRESQDVNPVGRQT